MERVNSQVSPNSGESLLSLKGVWYRYPSQTNKNFILSNINFTLHRGDVVVIRGRNGSGKTTLLKLIAGHINPVKGHILKYNDRVNVVYLNQHASEFIAPSLTVREQLLVGMGDRVPPFAKSASSTISKEVENIISLYGIGLPEKLDSFTSELSGGQQQVIALITALASKADVLLLDEYTSFMDTISAETSYSLIKDISETKHFAIVIVDHTGGIKCTSTHTYNV